MKKGKLERCGACGDWSADQRLYTQEEQDNVELIHCGCEGLEEQHYITKDMAIDAGDPDLEGKPFNF